ncbi:hypothetical protein [Streptomyces spectabilis]|uniref:hypothetical protein n=1 Tax=Streptomyces spectabilis TaxID=68270 RepID=UPI0018645398|nr:hypothetical protein [Streptomyces spectabilis]
MHRGLGPSEPVDGEPNPQAGDLDVGKLTSLGTSWGQFNVEKYTTLRPDVLISNMLPPPALWFVPEESGKKIGALAPSIGTDGARASLLEPLQRYTELAEALGGDLESARARAAKSRFQQAERTLRKAAKAHRGLKVLAARGARQEAHLGEAPRGQGGPDRPVVHGGALQLRGPRPGPGASGRRCHPVQAARALTRPTLSPGPSSSGADAADAVTRSKQLGR